MILRTYQLCSKSKDVDRETYLFMRRILDLGHSLNNITILFSKAILNTKKYLQRSPARTKEFLQQKEQTAKRQVHFHLLFTCYSIPTTPLWTSRGPGNVSSTNLMGSCY